MAVFWQSLLKFPIPITNYPPLESPKKLLIQIIIDNIEGKKIQNK